MTTEMTMTTMDGVTLTTKANVYFDGKCVSHSFTTASGAKKSAGVVLGPDTTLTFGTNAAEIMQCVGGSCEYRLANSESWVTCGEGEEFAIDGDSKFDIKVREAFHYVCHYA